MALIWNVNMHMFQCIPDSILDPLPSDITPEFYFILFFGLLTFKMIIYAGIESTYMFVKVWTDKRGLNLQFTASNCFRFYLLHQIASQFNVERINNTGNLTWILAYWVIFVSNSSIFSLLQCFDNLYSWIKCLTLTWIFLLILDTINSKLSIGSISQEMLSTPIKQNKIWCLNHLKRCIIHVHNTCVYANR